MKTVLAVDEDRAVRAPLSRLLEDGGVSVRTAPDAATALAVVKRQPVDLVVSDTRPLFYEESAFLQRIRQNRPDIPVFALLSTGTDPDRSITEEQGISRAFHKPQQMQDLEILAESILDELNAGSEGQIHSMRLPTFLQLIEMEEKTCTLRISPSKGGKTGKLYFVRGELYAAETGELENEDAAREIISWQKASIFIRNTCRKRNKQISQPLMKLLMEAGPRRSEKAPGDGEEPDEWISEIVHRLDAHPLVREYEVYDDQDRPLQIGGARRAALGIFSPSRFFAPLKSSAKAAILKNAGGGGSYIVAHTEGGSQLILFRCNAVQFVVSLRPGSPPQELIENLRFLPAAKEEKAPAG